jgi:hypothetical protein
MTIHLSEEQRQAVAAHPGEPVEVVDPATQHTYVLLAAEQYQRLRALLAEGRPAPAQSGEAAPGPAGCASAEVRPQRQRLGDLPVSAEVAEEAHRQCQKLGLWRLQDKQEIEEELKLQYYYGGQAVYLLHTPAGQVVIPIDEHYKDTPDLRYLLFTPEERPEAVLTFPPRWRDTASEVLTPFHHEG